MTKRFLTFFALPCAHSTHVLHGSACRRTEQETETQPAEINTVEKTLSFDKSTVIRESIPQTMFGFNHSAEANNMSGGDSILANDAEFLTVMDKEKYNEANPKP